MVFNGYKCAALAAMLVALPTMLPAASFTLDFGNISAPNFNTNKLIQYSSVASGINATLTADDVFLSGRPWRNGSLNGDIQVNASTAPGGQNIGLTLSLFDSSIGTGYESLYNPGTDFDWELVFYEIDGTNGSNVFYDAVTVLDNRNGNLSYTLTDPTDLVVTSAPGSVTFSGENAANVPYGETGGVLSAAQSKVSTIIKLTNTSVLDFIYTAVGRSTNQRNLLIDGGTLSLTGTTVTTPISPVPVPAAGLLLVAGIALLGAAGRRSRKA